MPEINAILFYATWCGHCNTFKPEWNKFKEMVSSNGKKDNLTLSTNEYEDSHLPEGGAKILNKDIRGYPTVKITVTSGNNSTEYEYQGKRTAGDLFEHVTKHAITQLESQGKKHHQ